MTTPQPRVKIALSVEIAGDWITTELIADLAVQLSDRAARLLAERVGEHVEPGPITLGVKVDDPAQLATDLTNHESREGTTHDRNHRRSRRVAGRRARAGIARGGSSRRGASA